MRKGDKIKVPRSVEHKTKLSTAMMGNKNQETSRSDETKQKIASSMRGNSNTLGKIYGAETRYKDRAAKMGAKNPAWNGGSSFEPYPPQFNIILKKSILVRDNYTCQLCKAIPKDKRKLHPHHIDYNKGNCDPGNLITLCHSCHSKTNHHRKEWGIFNGQFQRISINAQRGNQGSP